MELLLTLNGYHVTSKAAFFNPYIQFPIRTKGDQKYGWRAALQPHWLSKPQQFGRFTASGIALYAAAGFCHCFILQADYVRDAEMPQTLSH